MGDRTMSRNLRRAWICLVLSPVGFVLALVIGEVLPGLMGYGWTHEQEMDIGPSMVVMIPAVLLFSVPGLLAGWFGIKASRGGERVGLVPAVIGLMIAGYYLLLNIAGLLFGPLGG
jgi:hypothetical protein